MDTYTGAISPYPTVVMVTTTQYIPVGMDVKPIQGKDEFKWNKV